MDDIQERLNRILMEKPVSPDPVSIKRIPPKVTPLPVKATPKQEKRLFVVVTKDMSGLGWAKKLQEEGERVVLATKNMEKTPELKKAFELVGKGWVPRTTLEEAMKTLQLPHVYWIFDSNHFGKEADQLRAKGQKVFGTSELSAKMEYDRAYGVEVATKYGLSSPETEEFSTVEEGLKFLEANPAKAYVFKPDASEFGYLTFVPFRERASDANRELYFYLKHVTFDGTYILQERKQGVEVNVELWLHEGKPFQALVTLESKRKGERDTGEMAGCAADIDFIIPLDSPLIDATIGKLLPFYAEKKVTGFVDVNVIIGDNEVWFLEVCNRFGYSSHPNTFINLALDGFGNIMADWMDGKVAKMGEKFRKGYGASISLFIDHERPGLPLYLDKHHDHHFYPYDGYKDGEDLLLAGYSNEVGIFMDFDYTIQGAAEACLHKLYYNEAVSFPDMDFRKDLGGKDYHNAPNRRHEALRRMGYIT